MISHVIEKISSKFAITDAIASSFTGCFFRSIQTVKTMPVSLSISGIPSFSQGRTFAWCPLGILGRGGM